FNLCLRDALALAETLLESREPLGSLATLARYQARQPLDQDLTIGFSDRLTRLSRAPLPLLAPGRHLGALCTHLLSPPSPPVARPGRAAPGCRCSTRPGTWDCSAGICCRPPSTGSPARPWAWAPASSEFARGTDMQADIIIVGAGMVGSALALALKDSGLDI